MYGGADVHNDNPGEAILRLEAGSHHGYPFCMVAQRITGIAPGTQVFSQIFPNNPRDDAWCQNTTNVTRAVTFLQAHTAPMDIVFFLPSLPAGGLPERWRNGAFVSLHGAWNRSPLTGFRVVWVPFNADGTSPMPTNSGNTTTFPIEVVLSGGNASMSVDGMWAVSGGEMNVRPVGVAISPIDGALYISSDQDGYIYRVGLMR
jgi:glucose/arabinose dehydrogenase